MMREALTGLGFSESRVEGYAAAIRRDRYDRSASTEAEQRALEELRADRRSVGPGAFCFCLGPLVA